MFIDYFIQQFVEHTGKTAIVWKDREFTYNWLHDAIKTAEAFLRENGIATGDIVALEGDFTPNTIALLFALIEHQCIIVPFTSPLKASDAKKREIAQIEKTIIVNLTSDTYEVKHHDPAASHAFFMRLREEKVPGLVLFTSGSSGNPKGAVHNFTKLLTKFEMKRKALRTVNFLLFDHWGGLNTLFHTISNCGVVLATRNRQPEEICAFIDKYRIELLPVSPTFLNLLILSEAYHKYDLSSLKLITYGTEPMPETTLKRAKSIFPSVTFQQTYGLIELGVLRSKSKDDESLWVKIGGEGFQTRVVEDILQIKADSAMLGYLNAPSPFTDDGYFITGDQVLQDGEYFKILGRKSEIINVGGEKVYPQEVENIILGHPDVVAVMVYGEKNPLVGNIVCAKVAIKEHASRDDFKSKLKVFCNSRLESYKVPVKIFIEDGPLHNDRFKMKRA